MKIIRLSVNKSIFMTMAAVLLMLLTACADLDEPRAAAEEGIQEAGRGSGQQNDSSSDTSAKIVLTDSRLISQDQTKVTIGWITEASRTYSLVRSTSPDCDPLDQSNCPDYLLVASNVQGADGQGVSETDTNVEAGMTYHYWVISRPRVAGTAGAVQAQSASAGADVVVSEPLRVAIDFDDSILGAELVESDDTAFLQNVALVGRDADSVTVQWSPNQEMVVTVYASEDSECDVLDAASECAQEVVTEMPGADAQTRIETEQSISGNYFWILAKHYIPLLGDAAGQMQSRLYGPMFSYELSDGDEQQSTQTRQAMKLYEIADFSQHSLATSFAAPNTLIQQFANYNFYIFSGDAPAGNDLIKAVYESEATLESLQQAAAKDGLNLTYKQRNFQSLQQLSNGEMYTELGDIDGSLWYSLVIMAEENGQYVRYQPAARKSLQHMYVDVRGDNGLWQIKSKTAGEILFAKKTAGYYYPTTVDWRNLMIDARLAFEGKQAYYFTGCAYYEDEQELGGTSKLYDNECHYARADADTGDFSTVLSKPTPVRVHFERKANALACENYQLLPAHGYSRSRFNKLNPYGQAICDHRIPTIGNNGEPNHFAMVYPNGEATEIARSPVGQWYGGTQAPMYIRGTQPLPVIPDGMVTTTVCADLDDDQECAFKAEVKVFRCNGYYAYQLAEPTGCSVGYAWEESPMAALHRKAEESAE